MRHALEGPFFHAGQREPQGEYRPRSEVKAAFRTLRVIDERVDGEWTALCSRA